jgi:hypothetical protein
MNMMEVWAGYNSRQGVVLVSCENVDEILVSQNASTFMPKQEQWVSQGLCCMKLLTYN